VLIADVYGGVYRMTSQVYEPKGYVFDYLPAADFFDLATHLDERTRIVWIETPSNPLLNIVDIEKAPKRACGRRAPRRGQHLCDAVSTTAARVRGGHRRALDDQVSRRTLGRRRRLRRDERSDDRRTPSVPPEVPWAVPSPLDCWLVLRGIKTLAVRMRQHCQNAHALSGFLERHPRVEQTLYPGLPRHPARDRAKQMHDFGGMISFLAESEEEATAFVASTKIFKLAESLGGVESLIELPARMTHASTADAPFAAPRNLIRLSVGLESADDLLEDLEDGVRKVVGGTHSARSV